MSEKELGFIEEEENYIILTMDDGQSVNCEVVGVFKACNNIEYIALLPTEGPDADSGEVFLYRYADAEDGEPLLSDIEDDEEFEIASDAFDEMLDMMSFDELAADFTDEEE